MQLTDEVELIFQNYESKQAKITISVKQLIENSIDDFYEMLEEQIPCASSSCNNESQNFCDCPSSYEDYTIKEICFQPAYTMKESSFVGYINPVGIRTRISKLSVEINNDKQSIEEVINELNKRLREF